MPKARYRDEKYRLYEGPGSDMVGYSVRAEYDKGGPLSGRLLILGSTADKDYALAVARWWAADPAAPFACFYVIDQRTGERTAFPVQADAEAPNPDSVEAPHRARLALRWLLIEAAAEEIHTGRLTAEQLSEAGGVLLTIRYLGREALAHDTRLDEREVNEALRLANKE